MNDIFEEIKQIPITDILFKLGIKYKKVMGTLNLYDNGKISDGWKGSVNDNFVTDFSGKSRGQGDQLAFVESYLKIDTKQALQWFKNSFGLVDYSENMNYKQKKDLASTKPLIQDDYTEIDVKSKFNSLETLNKIQIDYIKSRGIDYEKIKDVVKNNNGIACGIYNEKGQIISINTRSITEKKFYILKGTQSKGVYMGKINKDIKKIYVVEGMFDFLSLYQFGVNVIGLKSVNDGLEVVKEFYKKGYEITVIPDNDEVGKNVLNELVNIRYNIFDLSKYEVKDINELLTQSDYGAGIIQIIEEEKECSYKDPINNKVKPYTWGTKLADLKLSPIERNHYIIFGGAQGQGKTTFTFDVADKNSFLGHKVLYLSLEMETENLKTNMARSYAGISKEEWRLKDIPEVKKKAYFKRKEEIESKANLILKGFGAGEIANTETIEKIILEVNPDLVFIDNFDLIQETIGDTLQKQEKISKFFLNFTNAYKIPCVIIHHMKKGGNGINGLRGSGKITDDADLVLSGGRKENAGNDEEKKLFIVSELKSRDWGSFETQTFVFEKGTFIDEEFGMSDYKQGI